MATCLARNVPKYPHFCSETVRVEPASAARGFASRLGGGFVVLVVRRADLSTTEAARALQLHADRFVAPHFFEVVVLAQRRLQDMDDSVAAIHQHPLADFLAFGADDVAAQLLDLIAHAVCQRFGLTIRRAAR